MENIFVFLAENLLDVSSKVFVNSQRFFDKQLYKDFLNNSSPYVESGRWEVKLKRMQSVYSVLIRTLGSKQCTCYHLNWVLIVKASSDSQEMNQVLFRLTCQGAFQITRLRQLNATTTNTTVGIILLFATLHKEVQDRIIDLGLTLTFWRYLEISTLIPVISGML